MEKLPQGIQYKLKQYCEDCPCFSINWRSWTDTEKNCIITEIECENEELCQKLLERFKKEARKQIIEELNTK